MCPSLGVSLRLALEQDFDVNESSLRPSLWRPLGKEGLDTFLSVGVEHVFHHDAGGMGVGVRQAHFDLGMERLLAQADRSCRFRGDVARETHRLGALLPARSYAVDKPNA